MIGSTIGNQFIGLIYINQNISIGFPIADVLNNIKGDDVIISVYSIMMSILSISYRYQPKSVKIGTSAISEASDTKNNLVRSYYNSLQILA